MGTGIIVTMASVAACTVFTEKLLNALQKPTEAQIVNVTGFSLVGIMAIGTVVSLIGKIRKLFA